MREIGDYVILKQTRCQLIAFGDQYETWCIDKQLTNGVVLSITNYKWLEDVDSKVPKRIASVVNDPYAIF